VVVGHANDVAFIDRLMGVDRLLDDARVDVEAGLEDEVLDAIYEEHVTVVIDVADVTGP
jgi:hypothetical protein